MPELARFYGIIIRMYTEPDAPHHRHPIYRVRSFEIVAPYTLGVEFDDGTRQIIDFRPVLAGDVYGPLRDVAFFNQVQIDPEVHTLVWSNGADFDPATLHDWPQHAQELAARAQQWERAPAGTGEGRGVRSNPPGSGTA